MNSMVVHAAMVLSAAVLFQGCVTMNDVLNSKENGSVRKYAYAKERVWNAAIDVLKNEGCESVEEDHVHHRIMTTFGVNMFTSGCLVCVWIEQAAEGETALTIVTMRKVPTNLITPLTETSFIRKLDELLESKRAAGVW